ncbi:hypothetical protein Syun_009062 [Stephania yunnanensis]|uniref:CCAAT-binding factor domain-containing protein n=1 Tax=Stephania yunnanensis TaxID=152371 RepID=A0AAP0KFH1_9MAGN
MAISKPSKPENPRNPKTPKDVELLKSDVASFASSLGLFSTPSSNPGFNDSDFRKKSSLHLKNPSPRKPSNPNHAKSQNEKNESKNTNAKQNKFRRNDKPRDSAVSVDPRPFDRWKNLPKLPLVKASALGQWFVEAEELEGKVMGREGRSGGGGGGGGGSGRSSEWISLVAKKKELGERLMAQYALDYEAVRGNDREIKMVFTAQRSGTAVDKVSAFSLLVGDNPIANLRSLDAILAMVTSKVGKRHALSGFESLKELFLSSLLPDRKLKPLIQRPLDQLPESKDGNSLLLFWHWEDCLKQRYERFVFALEEASRDMLPILKDKALKMLYALLSHKSEQERRLLSALVNKLGDPENKGASNADFYLSKLLTDHPNMKEVVINEVDSFLFRPHLNLRAKYHAAESFLRWSWLRGGYRVGAEKALMEREYGGFKGRVEGGFGWRRGEGLGKDMVAMREREKVAVGNDSGGREGGGGVRTEGCGVHGSEASAGRGDVDGLRRCASLQGGVRSGGAQARGAYEEEGGAELPATLRAVVKRADQMEKKTGEGDALRGDDLRGRLQVGPKPAKSPNAIQQKSGLVVNFLSQIRLSHKGDGPKVAKRMMDVYFALFKVLISKPSVGEEVGKNYKKKKEGKEDNLLESSVEMDSRILSALLTAYRFLAIATLSFNFLFLVSLLLVDKLAFLSHGVNRAFPFLSSGEADDLVDVQTPMLFKLVHSKNFNVGVQALMLLDKISTKNQVVSDRFYRALYSKLLLPAVIYSSKAEMFIGLLLRAMKNDINLKRVSAFSKRLLQVALQQPPQFACGCLFLLSEVLKARPPLWNMVLQSESIDADLEHFEDISEEPESEVGTAPSVNSNENHSVKTESNSSESESEDGLPDSVSSDDLSESEDILGKLGANAIGEVITASDHNKSQPQAPNMRLPGGYDPRHREPSYCNAEHVSWWELMVLASHVHPSVATMAMTLLSGTNIVYNGNPLNDLSLTAFLDKFMEKKPKQTAWHGGSQIEPAKKLDMNNHLIGAEILALAEADVPPEDVVFHRFYMNKMVSSKKPKKKKQKKSADDDINEDLLGVDGSDESDVEVGGDESDNEEIENMLDSADVPSDNEGDYDYDDLDKVANEDDEDLIGNGSDADADVPSDLAEEADDDDEDISQIDISDAFVDEDDLDDDDHIDKHSSSNKRKRNNKSKGRTGKSPFASVEDYEHLLKGDDGDNSTRKEPKSKKPKSRKRRKSSD